MKQSVVADSVETLNQDMAKKTSEGIGSWVWKVMPHTPRPRFGRFFGNCRMFTKA